MSFNFSSVQAKEHQNNAILGSFSDPGYDTLVYSYYFGEIDWLKFEDNNLYLADNWHFDFEFDQVVRYNEFREVDVSPGVEYQSSVGADYFTSNSFTPIGYRIPIKLTDDIYGEFISWRYIDLNFIDVDEKILVNPVKFAAYTLGAEIAEISSIGIRSESFKFNHTFLETSDNKIKLKDQYFYDPAKEIISNLNGQYIEKDALENIFIHSFEVESVAPNYIEEVSAANLLNKAETADIPFFAGTTILETKLSGEHTIDALLFENNMLWESNLKYSNNTNKTVITYSFVPNNTGEQKFALEYQTPDPNIDRIIGFEERHKEAAREALDEWAKVANIKFLELNETDAQYGTIRFGFTDHTYLEDEYDEQTEVVGWAAGPGEAPKNGDIWLAYATYDNSFSQGASDGFATLLHEIGHTLGLAHPFEGKYTLDTSLDQTNFTIMSYNDPQGSFFQDSNHYLISTTPMVYDISAIQYLYGSTKNNEDDTLYVYSPDQPFVEAIWDSAGYDTLDLSDFNKDCKISILPGEYSTIVCDEWFMRDNLGIAKNAILEKVIAGSGNDLIAGNSSDNHLIGNSGNDIINGGIGDDIIEGNNGDDILQGGLGADVFIFYRGDGKDTIKDYSVNEDEVKFYNALGQPVVESQITMSQNLDGDLVYSVFDDITVTLEGVTSIKSETYAPSEPEPTPPPATIYQNPTGINKILVEKYGYEWVNGKVWKPGTAPEVEAPVLPESDPIPKPTPEPEQPDPTQAPTPTPEPTPEPAPSYQNPTGINKILVEKYGYEWVSGKAWRPGTAPELETPVLPEPAPTPEPVVEPAPTPEPEQPDPIPEPTPTPEPKPTADPTPSYPEPTGINKILVEKYGYEWVDGKAWKPGTAPELETPVLPEPAPTPEPVAEPAPTPKPEQPAPTNEAIPTPPPETDLAPASDIELTLAEVEGAPTGISKLLVENYGYSWIDGKYYSKGTAPEVDLDGDAIHTVTVSKVGNQNVFFIDGNSNPDFVVEAGKTYRFDQSDVSNTNHPLNFLSVAGSDVTSYVEVSGTAGTEGAYVELYFDANDISNIDGPELSYYCEIHGAAMGNDIEISNIIF